MNRFVTWSKQYLTGHISLPKTFWLYGVVLGSLLVLAGGLFISFLGVYLLLLPLGNILLSTIMIIFLLVFCATRVAIFTSAYHSTSAMIWRVLAFLLSAKSLLLLVSLVFLGMKAVVSTNYEGLVVDKINSSKELYNGELGLLLSIRAERYSYNQLIIRRKSKLVMFHLYDVGEKEKNILQTPGIEQRIINSVCSGKFVRVLLSQGITINIRAEESLSRKSKLLLELNIDSDSCTN